MFTSEPLGTAARARYRGLSSNTDGKGRNDRSPAAAIETAKTNLIEKLKSRNGERGAPYRGDRTMHNRLIGFLFVFSAMVTCEVQPSTESGTVDSSQRVEQRSERGPVSAAVLLEPARPVIGDPLTLTLEVVAEAGVELIMPEFGQSLDRFSIVDYLPREGIDEQGRTLATQRYTLRSSRSGPQFVPPLSIEFVDRRAGMRPAPEGEDAYELITERLDFEVQSVLPDDTAHDLKPPLGTLYPVDSRSGPTWPWVLGFGALLLLGVAYAARTWLLWRARARRRSAYDIAHGRLSALMSRARPEGTDAVDAFFVELSNIVRCYLEDRFGLHAPELTTEEFLDIAAASPDLTTEHKGFLREFLKSADQVKFARFVPNRDYIESVLHAAGRFLEQTKEGTAQTGPSFPVTRTAEANHA